ncbi:MAG: hypothetical protein L0Y36_02865 [Planctomycetales bacterium]|nr:hypothetical protein [Planctomycetales bacterium]
MEAKKFIGLVLMIGMVSILAAAWGAEKKAVVPDPNELGIPAVPGAPRHPVRQPAAAEGRTSAERQQMYQKAMEQRFSEHKAQLAELEAIKKIAEEENAVRTAEAIQKLIDKKDAQFKQALEQAERQRRERLEQIQQRTPTPKARSAEKEQADTSEKKADPAK